VAVTFLVGVTVVLALVGEAVAVLVGVTVVLVTALAPVLRLVPIVKTAS